MANPARYLRGLGRSKCGPGLRVDYSHPLAQGLVGCWLFNEGAGANARDLSRYYATGDVQVSWAVARFGLGLSSSGNSEMVRMGDDAGVRFASNQSFSFVTWFKNTGSITSGPGLITKGISDIGSITNPWYLFRIWTTGKLEWNLRSSGGVDSVVDGATAVNDSLWHQAVAVADWSAQKVLIYLDGKQDGSASWTTSSAYGTNGEYFVVGNAQGSRNFGGVMDHVVAYNRALLAPEVFQLYSTPFAFLRQTAPRQSASFAAAAAAALEEEGLTPSWTWWY